MIQASGDTRKAIAVAFVTALATALGTKLVEFGYERIRERTKQKGRKR